MNESLYDKINTLRYMSGDQEPKWLFKSLILDYNQKSGVYSSFSKYGTNKKIAILYGNNYSPYKIRVVKISKVKRTKDKLNIQGCKLVRIIVKGHLGKIYELQKFNETHTKKWWKEHTLNLYDNIRLSISFYNTRYSNINKELVKLSKRFNYEKVESYSLIPYNDDLIEYYEADGSTLREARTYYYSVCKEFGPEYALVTAVHNGLKGEPYFNGDTSFPLKYFYERLIIIDSILKRVSPISKER